MEVRKGNLRLPETDEMEEVPIGFWQVVDPWTLIEGVHCPKVALQPLGFVRNDPQWGFAALWNEGPDNPYSVLAVRDCREEARKLVEWRVVREVFRMYPDDVPKATGLAVEFARAMGWESTEFASSPNTPTS